MCATVSLISKNVTLTCPTDSVKHVGAIVKLKNQGSDEQHYWFFNILGLVSSVKYGIGSSLLLCFKISLHTFL